jgi:transposase
MDIKKTRKKYDEDYKRHIVSLVKTMEKPVSVVAESLGIEQSIIHRWVKKYGGKYAYIMSNDANNGALRKEIRQLQSELITVKDRMDTLCNVVKKSLSQRYGS